MEWSLSKCGAALLELGEPYVAFFRGCVKFLASLRYVNEGEVSASDSILFTDQG
jgi:hypothetical protein